MTSFVFLSRYSVVLSNFSGIFISFNLFPRSSAVFWKNVPTFPNKVIFFFSGILSFFIVSLEIKFILSKPEIFKKIPFHLFFILFGEFTALVIDSNPLTISGFSG
jgi:hypothetical protein